MGGFGLTNRTIPLSGVLNRWTVAFANRPTDVASSVCRLLNWKHTDTVRNY